jgi:hypothetical protein
MALRREDWKRGKGPRPTKEHPGKQVPEEALAKVGLKPGIWLVTVNRRGKDHHSIIAVNENGERATQGGCYLEHRAIRYARDHAARFGLPIVADQASPSLQAAIERGERGWL